MFLEVNIERKEEEFKESKWRIGKNFFLFKLFDYVMFILKCWFKFVG